MGEAVIRKKSEQKESGQEVATEQNISREENDVVDETEKIEEIQNRPELDIDVEDEIRKIRGKYNWIKEYESTYDKEQLENGVSLYYDGDQLVEAVFPRTDDKILYARSYYYDDGKLIFAYYEGSSAHRFYFYDGYLIRWRYSENASEPMNAVNHDLEESEEFYTWEQTVLSDSEFDITGKEN